MARVALTALPWLGCSSFGFGGWPSTERLWSRDTLRLAVRGWFGVRGLGAVALVETGDVMVSLPGAALGASWR